MLETKPKETPEMGRIYKQQYYDMKKTVLLREDHGTTRVVAIRQKPGWFRFLGKSALIFHYEIAPKINYHSKWYKDDDFKLQLKGGVVNIRDIDMLIKMMEQHNYAVINRSAAMVVFNAKKRYSLADLDALQGRVGEEWDRVNKVFVPKNSMPSLYRELRQLLYKIYMTTKRMDAFAREVIGNDLVKKAAKLNRDYIVTCNQTGLDKSGYFERVLKDLDDIRAQLACISTVRELDAKAMSNIGKAVENVRLEVSRCKPKNH